MRKTAMLEYRVLAQGHAVDFQGKWISSPDGHEQPRLTAEEVSALADFTIAYGHIKRMGPFPADLGSLVGLALVGLALTVGVPLFPAVLAEIPLSVILKGLFEAVKAAPI